MEPFNSPNTHIQHGVRLERIKTAAGNVLGKITVAKEQSVWDGRTSPASKTSSWIKLEELREMRDWIDRLLEEENTDKAGLPAAVGTIVLRVHSREQPGNVVTHATSFVRIGPNRWRSVEPSKATGRFWYVTDEYLSAGPVETLYPEDDA